LIIPALSISTYSLVLALYPKFSATFIKPQTHRPTLIKHFYRIIGVFKGASTARDILGSLMVFSYNVLLAGTISFKAFLAL